MIRLICSIRSACSCTGCEIGRVKIGRNKGELDKIRPMITDLRDTFRAANKNVAEGRGGPAEAPLEAAQAVGE